MADSKENYSWDLEVRGLKLGILGIIFTTVILECSKRVSLIKMNNFMLFGDGLLQSYEYLRVSKWYHCWKRDLDLMKAS